MPWSAARPPWPGVWRDQGVARGSGDPPYSGGARIETRLSRFSLPYCFPASEVPGSEGAEPPENSSRPSGSFTC